MYGKERRKKRQQVVIVDYSQTRSTDEERKIYTLCVSMSH